MSLRDEVMLMLDKRGAVLETARRVSALMKQNGITGAVIGGVAVVLHGHLRTTRDVDIYVEPPIESMRPILENVGAVFDAASREFLLDSVPVHLVDAAMVQPRPTHFVEIEQVATVSLEDLINLKLRSGMSSIIRAQDIADVIGLIRRHNLGGEFASRIDKSLRPEFSKLAKAVRNERP